MSTLANSLDSAGYAVLTEPLPAAVVDTLIGAAEPLLKALPAGPRGGVRDLLNVMPAALDLARSPLLRRCVEPILGPECVAVSGLLFDKADGRNWKVPYHQDITIRVKRRLEVPGIDTWWEKAGVPHCWPPVEVVERMLAVRVHLDECGPENGPLRVLPGTHLHGVLTAEQIAECRERVPEVSCHLPRGGLMLMRPLLLHASSTASQPARRRVIHIEYAVGDLPGGLEWYEAWGPNLCSP